MYGNSKFSMKHQICNLYCEPVVLFKIDGTDYARTFFDEVVKNTTEKTNPYSQTNHNLINYHNQQNVFEIYEELKEIRDHILEKSNYFYKNILNHDSNLKLTQAWFNECGIDGSQSMHNHSNSVISGTLYLRTDKNTNIEFSNKHIVCDNFNQLYDKPNTERENEHGYYYHLNLATFYPKEGDCLFWPSYLKHGYEKNKTPNRLTLSFNLIPETLNCLYKL